MTNLIWHRDQQSDITRKGDLAYKCYRTQPRPGLPTSGHSPGHHIPNRQHDRQPEGHRSGKDRPMTSNAGCKSCGG
jgi:hypothetical protein